jgi:hypothetical protein
MHETRLCTLPLRQRQELPLPSRNPLPSLFPPSSETALLHISCPLSLISSSSPPRLSLHSFNFSSTTIYRQDIFFTSVSFHNMDHAVGHLVRRGMEAHANYRTSGGNTDGSSPAFDLPPWGAALLIGTVVIFVVILSMAGTLGNN